MLARVLVSNGIEVAVFEGDASRSARHQGGMLDVHVESGQAALRAGGLFEAFRARVLAEGDATRVLDRDGRVLLDERGNDERPEIERGALRDLLIDSLPDGVIRWDHRAHEIRQDGDAFAITFANGRAHRATALVGADGAWSKVRRLVSSAKPAYAGISFVESRITRAKELHPRLAAVVGAGSLFALAPGKGIMAHREPNDELYVYAQLTAPLEEIERIDEARALSAFDGWSEDLRGLIAAHDGPLIIRRDPRAARGSPVAARPGRHVGRRRGAPHGAFGRGREPRALRRSRARAGDRLSPGRRRGGVRDPRGGDVRKERARGRGTRSRCSRSCSATTHPTRSCGSSRRTGERARGCGRSQDVSGKATRAANRRSVSLEIREDSSVDLPSFAALPTLSRTHRQPFFRRFPREAGCFRAAWRQAAGGASSSDSSCVCPCSSSSDMYPPPASVNGASSSSR